MRLGDQATRRPANLATPDHATLAKHLYEVQNYTEIFDPATWGLAKHTTLFSLYMRPGNLATPDHATLA